MKKRLKNKSNSQFELLRVPNGAIEVWYGGIPNQLNSEYICCIHESLIPDLITGLKNAL